MNVYGWQLCGRAGRPDAAQAIADRLGEEARQRMETRGAIQSLMNPN